MKKIIAFAGSNSSTSINKQLVTFALTYFDSYKIELLDLNDFEMPIYSIDREKQSGIPEKAMRFREKMQHADGIICAMAEHNRGLTVAFKNIFDWCSRIDIMLFFDKPMLLMSTSPGNFGGGNALAQAQSIFTKSGGNIIETFSLPTFYKNFESGKITDETLLQNLSSKITFFKDTI